MEDQQKMSRSEAAKNTWKNRKPAYRPNKCICVRPAVWDVLNAQRGDRSWADYLCALAGVEPPADGRRNRE